MYLNTHLPFSRPLTQGDVHWAVTESNDKHHVNHTHHSTVSVFSFRVLVTRSDGDMSCETSEGLNPVAIVPWRVVLVSVCGLGPKTLHYINIKKEAFRVAIH